MLSVDGKGDIGNVSVFTSVDSGHSPEQVADMALNKIMMVNDSAPPV